MNDLPTHWTIPSPCYFCGKIMEIKSGQNFLECTRHNLGFNWVYHHYDKKTLELIKVYFCLSRKNDLYSFILYPRLQTTVINSFKENYFKELITFDHIPVNLTPETAKERLSFYLTYL